MEGLVIRALMALCLLLLGTTDVSGGSVLLAEFLHDFKNDSDIDVRRRSVKLIKMSDLFFPPDRPVYCAGGGSYNNMFTKEGDAPRELCTWSPFRRPGHFDQYISEFIMLRSWAKSTWAPTSGADVVILPSYLHHYCWKPESSRKGAIWSNVIQMAEAKGRIKSFWKEVVKKYYQPKRKYTPWIVFHYGFAWDAWNRHFLTTLAEQPSGFVERVIIMSLDGPNVNMKLEQRMKQMNKAFPTLLALPYPTGMMRPVNWTQSTEYYDSNRVRPFHMIFDGMWVNLRRPNKIRAWIKEQGRRHKDDFGFRVSKWKYLVAPKANYPDIERQLMLIKKMRLWEMAVNSDFCLEPEGDTPTRSHFYLAAQAGCIPVIFDYGGDGNYSAKATEWPFRMTPAPYRLDYTKFAVVYDAQAVLAGKVDVFKELMMMPTAEPERFRSLRNELVKASKWFTYTFPEMLQAKSARKDMSGWDTFIEERTSQLKSACPLPGVCDAFSALRGTLNQIIK